MAKLKKYTNKIEAFLHSDAGQRFFNIAYSVGAAIVIWGALFKILHLPGGNTLLCVGMGTEIAMFILTAFDRPPKEPNWEELVPAMAGKSGNAHNINDNEEFTPEEDVQDEFSGQSYPGDEEVIITDDSASSQHYSGQHHGSYGAHAGGGAGVVYGNPVASAPAGPSGVEAQGTPVPGLAIIDESGVDITKSVENMAHATENLNRMAELSEATNRFVDAIEGISKQMEDLHSVMATGSTGYAQQMADLNRNLAGLNTIYEIQLKNISGQLDAIDRVNRGLKDIRDMYEKSAAESAQYCEETEKMTKYMKQINAVYAKMITAMTINMHNPFGSAPEPQSAPLSTPEED